MRWHRITALVGLIIAVTSPVMAQHPGAGSSSGGTHGASGAGTAAASAGRPVATEGAAGGQGSGQTRRMPIGIAEIGQRSLFVSVAGRLRPSTRTQHMATAAGYVARVLVSEGQHVVEGQGLFTIQRTEVGQTYKPVVVESRVDGVVSQVQLEVSDEVKTGDPSVIVVADDGFVLDAMISDKDAFKVRQGENVVGKSPVGVEVRGFLTSRSQEPDYATGLFSLGFDFPATPGVYVGTLLIIELPTDTTEGVFVDRSLVTRRYSRYFLWAVTPENTLQSREVKLGPVFGEEIQISDGLAPGERYLTRLTGRERDGTSLSDLFQEK